MVSFESQVPNKIYLPHLESCINLIYGVTLNKLCTDCDEQHFHNLNRWHPLDVIVVAYA